MHVIGTAGHVDHGKSALVKTLTGTDPDRLPEEKRRGLTTDLGFACLRLPCGQQVGIVDVPGHERFVTNMVAGVGGIDLAILVVAADEGVMPQTLEHLAIINLLGIKGRIVVVSKCDLVQSDWLEMILDDIRQAIDGTSLATAPIIACSTKTKQGIGELVNTIRDELDHIPELPITGRPRLAVDRVFTLSGFGTVITGTLRDGPLQTGQEVEFLPSNHGCRIRGLQQYGENVKVAKAGGRTAVNLPGLSVNDIKRGMVLTTPGWLRPTAVLDVHLRTVDHRRRPIRHNTTVTFHSGSAEIEGRLLLLERDQMKSGRSGWAQLRLMKPAAVTAGDRFVLRDPNGTLGGGKIVDTDPKRHRRFHEETIHQLSQLERDLPSQLLLTLNRLEPTELCDLARNLGLSVAETASKAKESIDSGEVLTIDGRPLAPTSLLFTTKGLTRLAIQTTDEIADYHDRFPLRAGMPREELRTRLGLASRPFGQLLVSLQAQGTVDSRLSFARLPTYEPRLTADQQSQANQFLDFLQRHRFSSKKTLPDPDLITFLEDQGKIIRLDVDTVVRTDHYHEITSLIVSHLENTGSITLAQARNLLKTSRRHAQALLEKMDGQKITHRVGDERMLRRS